MTLAYPVPPELDPRHAVEVHVRLEHHGPAGDLDVVAKLPARRDEFADGDRLAPGRGDLNVFKPNPGNLHAVLVSVIEGRTRRLIVSRPPQKDITDSRHQQNLFRPGSEGNRLHSSDCDAILVNRSIATLSVHYQSIVAISTVDSYGCHHRRYHSNRIITVAGDNGKALQAVGYQAGTIYNDGIFVIIQSIICGCVECKVSNIEEGHRFKRYSSACSRNAILTCSRAVYCDYVSSTACGERVVCRAAHGYWFKTCERNRCRREPVGKPYYSRVGPDRSVVHDRRTIANQHETVKAALAPIEINLESWRQIHGKVDRERIIEIV